MFKKLSTPVLLALVLLALVLVIPVNMSFQANASPGVVVPATGAGTLEMLTKVGVTTTQYGVSTDTKPWDFGECYLYTTFDPGAVSQTLSIVFQHAAVAGQWVSYGSALAVTTDTITSTNFNIVRGNYGRVYATVVTTTNPVSYSVKCVVRSFSH